VLNDEVGFAATIETSSPLPTGLAAADSDDEGGEDQDRTIDNDETEPEEDRGQSLPSPHAITKICDLYIYRDLYKAFAAKYHPGVA
jgi:hypothetical protein